MEMVAQLRETHAASESQSQAIDLTKVPTPNILAPVVGCLIRNGNNKQPKMSLLTKTVVVGCLGCASSPQGLSLINWLSQCPGDKPLPQSSDGLVAASLTLCTQSQWFNGGWPANHEAKAGPQEKCRGHGTAVHGQQESRRGMCLYVYISRKVTSVDCLSIYIKCVFPSPSVLHSGWSWGDKDVRGWGCSGSCPCPETPHRPRAGPQCQISGLQQCRGGRASSF